MYIFINTLFKVPRLFKSNGRSVCKQMKTAYSDDATVQQLFEGLCAKDRTSLARAITLVETTNTKKQKLAQSLVSMVSADLQKEQDKKNGVSLSFRIGK